jgi:hypothetical protein
MYQLFNEFGEYMRLVKHKKLADHFVNFYGWKAKVLRKPRVKKEIKK